MTVKNEHNETIILSPEQEAIKRLQDKLKKSDEAIYKFEKAVDELKYRAKMHYVISKEEIQGLYNFKSEYLSLKSYAGTVVDLMKNK